MELSIVETVKNNPQLKDIALRMLMPAGQARPRLWVKLFINPFYIKRQRGSRIRKSARMDILPGRFLYLGRNSTIEDFSTVNNGVGHVNIGDNTRIGIGSVLIGPVSIGNNVRLAQHVVLSGLNHNYESIDRPIVDQGVSTSEILVDDDCWIGANTVILPGVYIGKHSIVAAGSVVTKDVPSNTIVAGNPARVVKSYDWETQSWERHYY